MLTPEQLKDEPFDKAYAFIKRDPTLTAQEKLIMFRSLNPMFRKHGWYESSKTIAASLGISPRQVKRLIKSLVRKEKLAPLYQNNTRILWPTMIYPEQPLFHHGNKIAAHWKITL